MNDRAQALHLTVVPERTDEELQSHPKEAPSVCSFCYGRDMEVTASRRAPMPLQD